MRRRAAAKTVLWALFAAAAATVLYFTLKPGPGGGPFAWWDKAQHFTAYFTLALLAALAARTWKQAALIALGLAVAGYGLEIAQFYVGRSYDLYDEAANAIGCLCGLLTGAVLRRGWRHV